MRWKPACEFVDQSPAGIVVAQRQYRTHFLDRSHYRRMFVDVAVTRRELGFHHPVVLGLEMRPGMFGEPELSEAAYSLCEMIGNRADRVPLSWDAVNVHISSMRLLRQSAGDTDAAGRQAVLQGLRKVTARILAETAAAE